MKQIIVLALLCISMQQLSASQITPSQDSIPFPKWSYGLQAEFGSNSGFSNILGYGVFGERRFSSLWALEAELTYTHNTFRFKRFEGQIDRKVRSINLALFGKLYFGTNKRWYSKMGYRFKSGTNVFNNNNDVILGVGHNLPLKNGHALKLEYNMSYNSSLGLNPAIKLGYRF